MGVIQGITEFLPVSSSGHLVLFQHFSSGFSHEDLFMDIMLHLGTLVAVVIYCRREVLLLIRAVLTLHRKEVSPEVRTGRRLLLALVIAGIPTAAIGFAIKYTAVDSFANLLFLAATFLVTTAVLVWSRFLTGDRKEITYRGAILVGAAQGLAVLPGISRSGTTIVTAQAAGMERSAAARFAFVLSIPAILAAAFFSAIDVANLPKFNTTLIFSMLCGMIAAALVGYISLIVLARIIRRAKLFYFAFYTGAVSIFCIAMALLS
jgi:undecaprenyl-diphosphatase